MLCVLTVLHSIHSFFCSVLSGPVQYTGKLDDEVDCNAAVIELAKKESNCIA